VRNEHVPSGIVLADWSPLSQLETKGYKKMRHLKNQEGKIGYIILWFLGVPASVLILIFLLRGCT
jgi:hypothetical protein